MITKLVTYRTELGMTQDEFAKSFGYSRCYYSLIELGKRKGTVDFWDALQEKYDLSDVQVATFRKNLKTKRVTEE